jgi:DUF917 family protein
MLRAAGTLEKRGDSVQLDASNLPDLARGCALLGAGGGGDPGVGLLMAEYAVGEHGPVEVVGLDDLPAGACVMPCGCVGSPAIADERLWGGDEGRDLVAVVESRGGGRVTALMCIDIAGANGVLPVTWAARVGLPLVDADARGRAFPRLEQQALHLAGIAASPVVLTDSRSTVVVTGVDDARSDRLAQAVASGLGGVCAAALACIDAGQAATAAIRGSVSRSVAVGRSAAAGVGALCEALDAVILMAGTVVDVDRGTEHGQTRGSATVQDERDPARRLRLEFQTECLLALEDGAVCASVPDVICVLSAEAGDPVAIERARFGDHVVVLAWPGPEVWRSECGLALAGPGAFGYDVDYVPLGHGRP